LEALAKILPGPTGREAQAWKDLNRLVARGVIAADDRAWYMERMFPLRFTRHAHRLGGDDQRVEQPRRALDQLEKDTERSAFILCLKSGQRVG
jgi:2-phospho-L-lactate transferase/gluconeogenesis factor (CofD/UPF0052 family)